MNKNLSFLILLWIFCEPILSTPSFSMSLARHNPETVEFEKNQKEAALFFKEEARRIPEKFLREFSVTDFAGINLETLIKHIEKTRVEWWLGLQVVGTSPDGQIRTGGNYHSRKHTIKFAYQSVRELKGTELFSVFALHESLGALGYTDENYQRSFGMYLLTQLEESNRQKLLQFWNNPYPAQSSTNHSSYLKIRDKEEHTFAEGGATGIGGGGDTISLRVKWMLFQHYREKTHDLESELQFFSRLNWIKIEPNPEHRPKNHGSDPCDSEFSWYIQKESDVLLYRTPFELMIEPFNLLEGVGCKEKLEVFLNELTDLISKAGA